MITHSLPHLSGILSRRKGRYPQGGLMELTYRCNLNCVHCYCKGSEDKDRELKTKEIKDLMDIIHKEGCLFLVLSGGEPLVREDFLEIYAYAKKKGFIITLFTNAGLFTKEIIGCLKKSPPYRIEITLNGITEKTYESITQVKGSFGRAVQNIKELANEKLPLKIKANSLKQNKEEIVKIKRWTEELLGRPSENKYYFQYDMMIFPRLNGDKEPLKYRLTFEEMMQYMAKDADMTKEYEKCRPRQMPKLERDGQFLYRCNSWLTHFFINPYGRLKFCEFSDKFSTDLKTASFDDGFRNEFSRIAGEKFAAESKCVACPLKPVCFNCPARAFLETGDEAAPVEYYCQLAEKKWDRLIFDFSRKNGKNKKQPVPFLKGARDGKGSEI